jgi:hypothetical protein
MALANDLALPRRVVVGAVASAGCDIMSAMRNLVRVVACVAAATLPLAAASRLARAAASARLVYSRGPGAEQCPNEEALRAAVGTRLGYDPFFAWAHDTLFVEITRKDGAFLVRIKLVDDNNMQRGAREISVKGQDCSAVIDAIGLTTSLTIDPSSLLGAGPSSSSPSSPASAAPASPVEPLPDVPSLGAVPPNDAPTPARSEPVSAHAGLGAIGSVGGAPSPAAGAALSAGLAWQALSIDLEARADLPATGAGASEVSPARVTSWLIAGSIVPCVHLRIAFGCAIASAGTFGATSTAVQHGDVYRPWGALGARAGVELPLGRPLSLRVYAELLVPLAPETLTIDGAPAYTSKPFMGDLGVAALWRFARFP